MYTMEIWGGGNPPKGSWGKTDIWGFSMNVIHGEKESISFCCFCILHVHALLNLVEDEDEEEGEEREKQGQNYVQDGILWREPGKHLDRASDISTTLWHNQQFCPGFGTGRRGHYERGLFTGISRKMVGLCFPQSGGSLESLDSLERPMFQKTPFSEPRGSHPGPV